LEPVNASSLSQAFACWLRLDSLSRVKPPLGPYCRPVPRVLGGSYGGGRFNMSEVPLYWGPRVHLRQRSAFRVWWGVQGSLAHKGGTRPEIEVSALTLADRPLSLSQAFARWLRLDSLQGYLAHKKPPPPLPPLGTPTSAFRV
jgi:hypothetical protein